MRKVPKPINPLRIANAIAADLFCVGHPDEAQRLVMETIDKRNGGGWCRQAVRDIAIKHIEAALAV